MKNRFLVHHAEVYKTISGLNRHSDVDSHVIDINRIRTVLYSACRTTFEDQCYGKRINVASKKYFEALRWISLLLGIFTPKSSAYAEIWQLKTQGHILYSVLC